MVNQGNPSLGHCDFFKGWHVTQNEPIKIFLRYYTWTLIEISSFSYRISLCAYQVHPESGLQSEALRGAVRPCLSPFLCFPICSQSPAPECPKEGTRMQSSHDRMVRSKEIMLRESRACSKLMGGETEVYMEIA